MDKHDGEGQKESQMKSAKVIIHLELHAEMERKNLLRKRKATAAICYLTLQFCKNVLVLTNVQDLEARIYFRAYLNSRGKWIPICISHFNVCKLL